MLKYGFFPDRNTWDFPGNKQRLWTWKLENNQIEEGLETLGEYKNLPEHEYGPLTLNILWHFRLTEPNTKNILPNQDLIPILDERLHNSRALLTLREKSKLSVWFVFPFDKDEQVFKEYIHEFIKQW